MFAQMNLETSFSDAAVRAMRTGIGFDIGMCLNMVFPVGYMNGRVRTEGALVNSLVAFLLEVSPVSNSSLPQHL